MLRKKNDLMMGVEMVASASKIAPPSMISVPGVLGPNWSGILTIKYWEGVGSGEHWE
jgi:hypothetical protein